MRAEELLTVAEYAALARLHPKTVYRLIRLGKLEVIRIGGAIRLPASALRSSGAGGGA